jgi:hypothetical protein
VAVTLPSGLKPGDLLLCALHVAGGSGVTITPPPEWTSVLATNDGATARLEVFRARYLDGFSATHTFTFSASGACVAQTIVYGGVEQAAPVDAAAGQANASSTSSTAPSVTTTKGSALLVAFWAPSAGARTATPPVGMTERADTQGAALALSVADAIQASAGASGTKVATLSGASASIGQLVALAPAALNSVAQVRDEGGWRYEAFAPRFASDAAFDPFVESVIQRANRELFRRVGASFYAENVLADPGNALLQKAEMHLAQSELLNSAAGLVGTADDDSTRPYLGRVSELRTQSFERRRRANEIIALCKSMARPGPGFPFFTAGPGAPPVRALFDDLEGRNGGG